MPVSNNIKFLEHSKQGLRRKVCSNKCRSQITTQPKNNNLDCMIDPTFKNTNRLFVLSFENGDNHPARNSSDKYYMPLNEIEGFNALTRKNSFLINP